MAYTTVEGRQELLDRLADAIDWIGVALAAFGEAYEQLDDDTADRLEEALFSPVQGAYGRARRTHAGFAERSGLSPTAFEPQSPGSAHGGARGFIDHGAEAIRSADMNLADLQDSMLPVEIGDVEVRAGLTATREALAELPGRARELLRTLGR